MTWFPFPAAALIVLATTLLPGTRALAADEEIQVYMDEIGAPGRPGLDVHLNFTPKGRVAPDFPGQQASEGRLRVTPEWSYALDRNLELGLYLPLLTLDRDGRVEAGGVKGRVKWIAPRPADQDWFWGFNLEVGRVRRDLDVNPWNAELKGVWGARKGPWTLAANFNVDWVVSGPQPAPVDFQLATKLAYQIGARTAVGLESYDGLGAGRQFGRLARADHQTYLTLDRRLGDWDLNLGAGYGYGAPEDRWVVKAVVGIPLS